MRTHRIISALALASALLLPICVTKAQQPPAPTAPKAPEGPGGGGDRPRFDMRNFDPAQMQKMVMDGYRKQLEVESDEEWKIIEARVQKVLDARRATGSRTGMGGMMGMFGGMGGMGGGGGAMRMPGGENGPLAQFMPPAIPEEEALKKALDAKAPTAELKNALVKVIEVRKQKQAALDKARVDLREVLSVRQEATATIIGLF